MQGGANRPASSAKTRRVSPELTNDKVLGFLL